LVGALKKREKAPNARGRTKAQKPGNHAREGREGPG